MACSLPDLQIGKDLHRQIFHCFGALYLSISELPKITIFKESL